MPGNTIGTGLIVASAHLTECLLLAHRVISLRSGTWSLLVHSGLWQGARVADLWVHGLVLRVPDNRVELFTF